MLSPSEFVMLAEAEAELLFAVHELKLACHANHDDQVDDAIGRTFGKISQAEKRIGQVREHMNARRRREAAIVRARGEA